MSQYNRNDPSSLSFGARLRRAEFDAAQAKQELADLKQSLPHNRDLQAAALSGEAIKAQRRAAKQLISRADSTLAELSAIDPFVLTSQAQEQLRLSRKDAELREGMQEVQPFQFETPQAEARFRNWASALPQQDFTNNNVLLSEQSPQRPFDVWSSRQDSPEGRYQRNLKQHQQLHCDVMIRRAEVDRSQSSGKRRPEGGIDMTNGTRT